MPLVGVRGYGFFLLLVGLATGKDKNKCEDQKANHEHTIIAQDGWVTGIELIEPKASPSGGCLKT